MKEKLEKLLKNKEFIEVIINGFLGTDVFNQIFYQPIDSNETIDKLKAKQILKNYLDEITGYDIIEKIKGKDE